jgi:glutathione synthase/RimK-type ligase-like ATP-grasp enzyme
VLVAESTGRVIEAALRRSAEARGLNVETFGHGWVIRLADGDRRASVFGYDFELNSATAAKIAGDKSATYDLLDRAGLPAVEHRLFLRPDVAPRGIEGNDREAMIAFAEKHHWDLVCKSNAGTGGRNVYHVVHEKELDEAVQKVFASHHAVALSPFVEVDGEFRVVMLDGAAQLVYEKHAAPGEWRHNLGKGGRAVDVADDERREAMAAFAVDAMAALGLRFGSVDMVDVSGDLFVLEVNAGVMMEHYGRSSDERRRLVEGIYDRAVAAMFA